MSLLARQGRGGSASIIAMGLTVLAFLVVAVKFVGPILYYISERVAGHSMTDVPVMWDFWWPVYLLVAAFVYDRSRRAWLMFLGLGVARILWAAIVLTLFFAKPEWNFWTLQWLFYEVVVLAGMIAGVVAALSPATREEMLTRARSISLA